MAFKDRQEFLEELEDVGVNNPDIVYDATDTERPSADFRSSNTVKHYGETDKMKFPNLIMYIDKLETYQVRTLAGMLKKQSYFSASDDLVVYLNLNGELIEAGLIERRILKRFLENKVFGVSKIVANLDDATSIEGDMLYALCTFNE